MRSSFIRPGRSPLVTPGGKPMLHGPKINLTSEVHVILVRPNGDQSLYSIERGNHVYWKASAFIAKGGRYAAQITGANDVHLVALLWHAGINDWAVLCEEQTTNDHKLRDAVDRIVVKSFDNMDKKMLVVAG